MESNNENNNVNKNQNPYWSKINKLEKRISELEQKVETILKSLRRTK